MSGDESGYELQDTHELGFWVLFLRAAHDDDCAVGYAAEPSFGCCGGDVDSSIGKKTDNARMMCWL